MAHTNTYTPDRDRVVLGVFLMIAFCVTAPILDVFSKLASTDIPVGQITAARFVIQAAIMVPMAMIMGKTLRFSRAMFPALLFRAIMLIASTYCFVAAIEVMPIADALAIVFVEPFILLIIGKYVYGETVGPRRLGASIIGFFGVVLIIQPSFAAFGWVALFPLGTALFFALYMLVTRSISRKMNTISQQAHTAWIGSLICVPILWLADGSSIGSLDPIMPKGVFWIWLIGVGVAASVSHLFMSYALAYAPSATLAPLHYLEIISAVILGYLVFGDIPDQMAVNGMLIVIGCGLYIVYREQKLAKAEQL